MQRHAHIYCQHPSSLLSANVMALSAFNFTNDFHLPFHKETNSYKAA
jgi:hypothetical protein